MVLGFRRSFTVVLVASCSVGVLAQTVQKAGLTLPASAVANKAKAQKLFTDSYEAYRSVSGYCHPPVPIIS